MHIGNSLVIPIVIWNIHFNSTQMRADTKFWVWFFLFYLNDWIDLICFADSLPLLTSLVAKWEQLCKEKHDFIDLKKTLYPFESRPEPHLWNVCVTGPFPEGPMLFSRSSQPLVGRASLVGSLPTWPSTWIKKQTTSADFSSPWSRNLARSHLLLQLGHNSQLLFCDLFFLQLLFLEFCLHLEEVLQHERDQLYISPAASHKGRAQWC